MKPWDGYFKPTKIFGNLYFVGTEPASTHIIDTGDGLIMLDSGYQHSLYLVIHNMHLLGLNPLDLKYIVHTHGHIDHFGGTRALVELTGAKTFLGKEDRQYANGELDLSYAKELKMEFNETFEPDVLLSDGDLITLGNTTIRCVHTPGHTPGAMSFIFNVTDGKETYVAGLHGGMGINTMCKRFLDKYNLSYDCREQFKAAMDRLKEEHIDIFLGNHMQHNHTIEKAKALAEGNEKAFIDPTEWAPYADWAKENLVQMEEKERIKALTENA
ncbi:MAG: MBL fold metallo-hydrolase [Clostridia bacterium]|nr:MBL fold metallo-hydrolase [Clostridia bacterium]MBQ6614478.1 MBL fold metallo-hydrolase [Clostridia bacterium]